MSFETLFFFFCFTIYHLVSILSAVAFEHSSGERNFNHCNEKISQVSFNLHGAKFLIWREENGAS